jgi:hypothetical protein
MAEPIALMTGFGSPNHRRPQWQRIGNQFDAAMIFARADFVKLRRPLRLHLAAILSQSGRKSDSGASLCAGQSAASVINLSQTIRVLVNFT